MGCGASAAKAAPAAKLPPEPPASKSPASQSASQKAAADAPKSPKAAVEFAPTQSPKARGGYGDQTAADVPMASGGYEAAFDLPYLPDLSAKAVPFAPPPPVLYYYPFAGRGELTRLIAAVGGVEIDEQIELPDKVWNLAPFGSPGTWPCLEVFPKELEYFPHLDSMRISQSFAIESYVARIALGFKDLTPIQRAEDAMLSKIKEEMIAGYVSVMSSMIDDASEKAAGVEDIAVLGDKWFPVIESRLPAEGFINGLVFPTVADLAVLNIARGFIPFGAAYLMGKYNVLGKFPKFAAHADRVAAHPTVKAYLDRTSTMDCDPMSLREAWLSIGDAVEVRDKGLSSADWKSARVVSLRPLHVKVDGWTWSTSWDEVRLKQVPVSK